MARNLIARANLGRGNVIILGAHYDTRRLADQTPGAAESGLPVPGAVDGASGVAVLLELGRSLDLAQIPREIWLVFFDVEDNGRDGIPGWDYAAGSPAVADSLTVTPEAVVVIDMVGDADQQLYFEGNSDLELSRQLWSIAANLGYNESFIPTVGHTMIDDHLAFVQRGIRTVLIIDFDYPYWHTVEDTLDKTSPDSLSRVGHTLETWLENQLDE
jgi:glutaminyl-peptide cyclotransferase